MNDESICIFPGLNYISETGLEGGKPLLRSSDSGLYDLGMLLKTPEASARQRAKGVERRTWRISTTEDFDEWFNLGFWGEEEGELPLPLLCRPGLAAAPAAARA